MTAKKRIWEDVLTERDKKVFAQAGFGRKTELGQRPAFLIIDATYEFVGDRPEPILESIKRFPLSSGEEGWASIEPVRRVLEIARKKKLPIAYSAPEFRPETSNIGATKSVEARAKSGDVMPDVKKIVKEIAPQEGEMVVYKQKASVFFGTPLISFLTRNSVDTLLVGGGTTSGCVRASVVDAFSYGFKVAVVEECTFDRGQTSHKMSLFDMHQKYADVISLEEALEYLGKL